MFYTPAPPGSRLFLDFTRDQFCGKVLDRSGMCGEPAVLGGVPPIWIQGGLSFAASCCVVQNNPNIDILSASPHNPVIWWFDMQLIEPRAIGWFFRKAFEPNSTASQYGFYMADASYIQVRVNGASANLDITSNVYSKKERFFLSVFWDGEKIYGYINGKLLAQNTLVTTIPSVGGDLAIGMRDPAEAGEVVINGNANWYSLLTSSNCYSYTATVFSNAVRDGHFTENNDDKPYNKITAGSDGRGLKLATETNVRVRIEKNKIDSMLGIDTLEKWKNYLNTYPITLKYETSDMPAYFSGNIFQCGITVGASISELHEWYRKYKTGNLQNTSIVAMQSETLPDGALDTFKR
jgi:hypothetical protein